MCRKHSDGLTYVGRVEEKECAFQTGQQRKQNQERSATAKEERDKGLMFH